MRPLLHEGWLCVPYDGPDAALVRIGIGPYGETPTWTAAFLDYANGVRVAKIRATVGENSRQVLLEVAGGVTVIGFHP